MLISTLLGGLSSDAELLFVTWENWVHITFFCASYDKLTIYSNIIKLTYGILKYYDTIT